MADEAAGKEEAGADVIPLEPGIMLQDHRRFVAGREHSQHMLHRKPPAVDDYLDGRTI
jgi:hypothetical protein